MPSPSARDMNDAVERFRSIERRLHALECGTPLDNASMTGRLRVRTGGRIQSEDFDGTGPEDPGTVGWWLGGTDAGAVFNTLALRKGIIGNDALTNPVEPGMVSGAQTGWGTATTDEDRAVSQIEVPPGFTQAIVRLTVTAGAVNDTANADFMYLSAVINGSASREMPGMAGGNNGWANVTTGKVAVLTGLSGSPITVAARIHTQAAAWSANSVNRAYVEADATFLR